MFASGVFRTNVGIYSPLRALGNEHPLPGLVLEYRRLHKAHATFVAGVVQHVHNSIVTPSWVQTAAATGRIACNNPNLQAIPRTLSLQLLPDADHEQGVEQVLRFRAAYVSRAGRVLLAADFQHIECRVFALAAADEELSATLASPGDLFRKLAAKWLKKPENSVCEVDRSRTKQLVYALLYGAGSRKLMNVLDVPYEQALQVQSSFNRTFPAMKAFGASVVATCQANGGRVTTFCGRTRSLHNICSADMALRAQAERQAVNFIVQGTAADLCKLGMAETTEALRGHSPPLDAHLLLQIHDELVWEVRGEHLHAAAAEPSWSDMQAYILHI